MHDYPSVKLLQFKCGILSLKKILVATYKKDMRH